MWGVLRVTRAAQGGQLGRTVFKIAPVDVHDVQTLEERMLNEGRGGDFVAQLMSADEGTAGPRAPFSLEAPPVAPRAPGMHPAQWPAFAPAPQTPPLDMTQVLTAAMTLVGTVLAARPSSSTLDDLIKARMAGVLDGPKVSDGPAELLKLMTGLKDLGLIPEEGERSTVQPEAAHKLIDAARDTIIAFKGGPPAPTTRKPVHPLAVVETAAALAMWGAARGHPPERVALHLSELIGEDAKGYVLRNVNEVLKHLGNLSEADNDALKGYLGPLISP